MAKARGMSFVVVAPLCGALLGACGDDNAQVTNALVTPHSGGSATSGPLIAIVVPPDANAYADGFPAGAIVTTCPSVRVTFACTPQGANACPATSLSCTLGDTSPDCSSGTLTLSQLGDGIHVVTATGTDALGEAGPTASTSFYVDATAPAVHFALEPAGFLCAASGTVPWSTSAFDVGATFTCALESGAGCTGSAAGGDVAELPDGPQTITVTATDLCGNTRDAVTTFIVATAAPSLGELSPASGSVNGVNPPVSFKVAAADPDPSVHCTVAQPGGIAVPVDCVAGVDNDFGLDATGDYTVTVTATDHCGNESSASATFSIDANRPSRSG